MKLFIAFNYLPIHFLVMPYNKSWSLSFFQMVSLLLYAVSLYLVSPVQVPVRFRGGFRNSSFVFIEPWNFDNFSIDYVIVSTPDTIHACLDQTASAALNFNFDGSVFPSYYWNISIEFPKELMLTDFYSPIRGPQYAVRGRQDKDMNTAILYGYYPYTFSKYL